MKFLEWQYLIFVLPFIFGLLYLFLMVSGLAHEGGDVDHDVDIDHDIDIGHDFHAEGFHHDTDSEATGSNSFLNALSFLGVGKVPFSIVIMSFCFTWGFSGWASNELVGKIIPVPLVYVWVSVGVAFVSSITLTRFIATTLARFMPSTETYCIKESELVGKRATAKYPITEVSGSATLYDRYNNLQEVLCYVESGAETIPAGTTVVLMRYQKDGHVFYVRPDMLGQLVDQLSTQQ